MIDRRGEYADDPEDVEVIVVVTDSLSRIGLGHFSKSMIG
jgi:hypothetical protein